MELSIQKEMSLAIPYAESKDFGKINPIGHLRRNTIDAYTSDLSHFACWLLGQDHLLNEKGRPVRLTLEQIGQVFHSQRITHKTIANFIQEFGFKFKRSTLHRKLAAITWMLKEAGKPVVTRDYAIQKALAVHAALSSDYLNKQKDAEDILKESFVPPERSPVEMDLKQAPPMLIEHLERIIDYLDGGEHGMSEFKALRLKTIILVWWHGAFRVSEVTSLRIRDISFLPGGMRIRVRNSKTDKKGEGVFKPFIYWRDPRYCAISYIRQWLEQTGRNDTYLFKRLNRNGHIEQNDRQMTRQSLTRMLKTVAKQAGINEPFQGHSPRRGFVTSAWLKGARGETIKAMGWNSNAWERYVEGLGGLNDHPFHTEK